jgi:hypothetical protein
VFVETEYVRIEKLQRHVLRIVDLFVETEYVKNEKVMKHVLRIVIEIEGQQ